MKKWVLILLMLLLTLPGYALITIEKKPGTGTLSGHLDDINANDLELDGKIDGKVSDDAFTSDWGEVTDVAPSQAALYNYLINFDADGDGLFSDEAWFPAIFDPAVPGEIGGTTPAAGTFTDLVAGTLALTPVDGQNRLTFPENTTRSPASGAEEIYNEGGLMKYSENGVEKNFVTIDDTAGDGDTTVTLSADKIAEYIASVSGAAGYVSPPTYSDSTGTTGQYSWDASYYYICTATNTWDRFAITRANWSNPTPDTTDPEISILTPAADGSWVDSVTYTLLAGTASDNIGVNDIYWKLESGGTYANTNVTGTTTWSVSSITLQEGLNSIYVRARDAATNDAEAVRTINVDTTDPVVGTVTPSALTHSGTGETFTATIASTTEANEDYRQWSLYDVTDASVQVDWATFTGLSISGISIPADQHTYRIDVRVTDLAGNTATASSSNIVYYSGATNRFVWDCSNLTASTYDADDGGTITAESDGTPTYSFVAAHTGNGIQLSTGTRARFPASQGNNIDYSVGGMQFYYKYTSGTPSSTTHIVSATYTATEQFLFRRSSVDNDSYTLRWAGGAYAVDTSINIFDGNEHLIKLEWNCSAQTFKTTIDGTEYNTALSSTTVPTPAATQRIYFNGYGDSADNQTVIIDEVKIW